jgi:Rha family phage regulatory protein
MGNLVSMIKIEVKDGQSFCNSLEIAENFGKAHKDVLKAIQKLIADLKEIGEGGERNFAPGTYSDTQTQLRPMYHMTRDGFALLAMGFTGKESLKWKSKYISAFNEMEKVINNQAGDWAKARSLVKEVRRSLTDRVKEYADLAVKQGSEMYKQKPQLAYINISKMTNKALGIDKPRDNLTEMELSQLAVTENRIDQILETQIKNNEPYKEIFQTTKQETIKLSDALGVVKDPPKVLPRSKAGSKIFPS